MTIPKAGAYLARTVIDAAIGSIALVGVMEAAQWARMKWRRI